MVIKMNSENRNVKQDEFSIEKYFVNENNIPSDNFIKDLKKLINNHINEEKIIDEPLYRSSINYIYYPSKSLTNNSKNILLITHELSRTGAPIVVLDTAKVLVKNNYFVTVISLKDGPLMEEFINIGVPVIIMPQMKYVQYLKSETCHFFDKMDLDIFVNHFDITIMVTATLYNFVRRYFNTRKKIFWWIHEGSESYNILDSGMPKNITPNIKVFCGGQYAADQLAIRGYHYYPNVLNYGVFDEAELGKKSSENNNKVRFLLAGTIGKRKGQLVLLKAIQKLTKKYQNKSEFIFIGDPYENDLEGMNIKQEIQEYAKEHANVKLYKSVSRTELYKIYDAIDVLVLASIDDPMPVVATENFMLGNICLCSNRTGTSYYIEDKENGFVFQSDNSDELYKKIIYIIDHKTDLEEIKKKGRQIYENYFEIGIFERKIMQLIQEELK